MFNGVPHSLVQHQGPSVSKLADFRGLFKNWSICTLKVSLDQTNDISRFTFSHKMRYSLLRLSRVASRDGRDHYFFEGRGWQIPQKTWWRIVQGEPWRKMAQALSIIQVVCLTPFTSYYSPKKVMHNLNEGNNFVSQKIAKATLQTIMILPLCRS